MIVLLKLSPSSNIYFILGDDALLFLVFIWWSKSVALCMSFIFIFMWNKFKEGWKPHLVLQFCPFSFKSSKQIHENVKWSYLVLAIHRMLMCHWTGPFTIKSLGVLMNTSQLHWWIKSATLLEQLALWCHMA